MAGQRYRALPERWGLAPGPTFREWWKRPGWGAAFDQLLRQGYQSELPIDQPGARPEPQYVGRTPTEQWKLRAEIGPTLDALIRRNYQSELPLERPGTRVQPQYVGRTAHENAYLNPSLSEVGSALMGWDVNAARFYDPNDPLGKRPRMVTTGTTGTTRYDPGDISLPAPIREAEPWGVPDYSQMDRYEYPTPPGEQWGRPEGVAPPEQYPFAPTGELYGPEFPAGLARVRARSAANPEQARWYAANELAANRIRASRTGEPPRGGMTTGVPANIGIPTMPPSRENRQSPWAQPITLALRRQLGIEPTPEERQMQLALELGEQQQRGQESQMMKWIGEQRANRESQGRLAEQTMGLQERLAAGQQAHEAAMRRGDLAAAEKIAQITGDLQKALENIKGGYGLDIAKAPLAFAERQARGRAALEQEKVAQPAKGQYLAEMKDAGSVDEVDAIAMRYEIAIPPEQLPQFRATVERIKDLIRERNLREYGEERVHWLPRLLPGGGAVRRLHNRLFNW